MYYHCRKSQGIREREGRIPETETSLVSVGGRRRSCLKKIRLVRLVEVSTKNFDKSGQYR